MPTSVLDAPLPAAFMAIVLGLADPIDCARVGGGRRRRRAGIVDLAHASLGAMRAAREREVTGRRAAWATS